VNVVLFTETNRHRGVAAKAVATVAGFRGLDSSCSMAIGGTTAPRDLNVAPASSPQLTS
jgi:hypothetical protein